MSPRTFVVGMMIFYGGIAINHVYTDHVNKSFMSSVTERANRLLVEAEDMNHILKSVQVTDSIHIDASELRCMQKNVYWESRNQPSREGWAAVAYVVLNRVNDSRYPDSICGVVKSARRDAAGNPIRNQCAFSWHCNGRSDTPNLNHPLERAAWELAGMIAEGAIIGELDNPVGDSLFYHADYVNPQWASKYTQVAQIDSHIFYSTIHL